MGAREEGEKVTSAVVSVAGLPWAQLSAEVVAGDQLHSWSIRTDEAWCTVFPRDRALPAQGWKLHLSATPASAAQVLERALPVLVDACCAFKFAADAERARWLSSARCPRETIGKFLTAYPNDQELFCWLAEELDRVTAGLAGPQILSDRRYRPGSIVHYRFGGFVDQLELDDDGCYRRGVVDPAGRTVEDRREAWYAPPSWVQPPFPEAAAAPAGPSRPVLVGGRFLLRQAIRHSSRGGVFRGLDQVTGRPVVVKQARAYIDLDPSGRDCRDLLRHAFKLLGLLAPLGLAPRPVGLVEEHDHVFLAHEAVAGTTLRDWVARHLPGGAPIEAGLRLARSLVGLMDRVHREGLVMVDVSPTNVIVDPTGGLWLTDLDHAVWEGQPIYPVGTPGYTPPEHLTTARTAARRQADLFGLGGLLYLIAVGAGPVVLPDTPPGRAVSQLLRTRLEAAGDHLPLAARLRDAVAGLTEDRPDARWRPPRVIELLDRPAAPATVLAPQPAPAERHRTVDRLIEDGVANLLATMTPQAARLWPPSRFSATTDPCAVQHGAAGVLATLVHVAPRVADPDRVRRAACTAGQWLVRRLPDEHRLLPGLYFGRSGTAWALHDAHRLTGDRRLAATALDLAARVPAEWPNPDVAHGAAGAGMAQLHLWRATGDRRFEERARRCADALVGTVHARAGALSWPIPATLRSTLAGRTLHGYAHGTAGVAGFLLAAGTMTGQREYLRVARRAAETLAAAAACQGGAAYWPTGPDGEVRPDTSWCKGSAGIGTFLLHAWQVTGEAGYLELARAAGLAAYRARFRSSTDACHGLAGAGHYLLDLSDALDLADPPAGPAYRQWAWELAGVMAARAAWRGGRLLVPDETGQAVVADYGAGLAGVVEFLVRLRHGGPRPWTARP